MFTELAAGPEKCARKACQHLRALIATRFTKETFYFFLLALAIAAFAGTMIALDEAGYLSR